MNYVDFGSTGQRVSQMCLGTMMFGERCDEAESERILSAAMDQGITFVDTAAMYGQGRTEEIMGRILKGRRDQLFIVTKVTRSTDAAWIRESIDESLARLQLDYVDLYLIHWPREQMHTVEMMEGLNDVVLQGKARFVGCSNFPAWLVAHCNAIAQRKGWAPLICNQVPYNLIERGIEVEVLPQAAAEGIAIMTYRPLLIGILAGKYQPGQAMPADSRGQTDGRIATWVARYADGLRRFNQFASERGLHPAQLAIAWQCHTPGVTSPIAGVSSLGQLQASIDAFDVALTAEEYAEISAMFDTAVKEESGGNYPNLRRSHDLVAS
ncbi:MAG: aldo/keto reductase [Chloroflexota bacterium]|nr:aldo/keto reductase [Chloroflexota bacterium]